MLIHGMSVQVYSHPTDPTFKGYRPGSVFYGSEVGNRLPSSAYASYDLVEAGRSLIAAALQGALQRPRCLHLFLPWVVPVMLNGSLGVACVGRRQSSLSIMQLHGHLKIAIALGYRAIVPDQAKLKEPPPFEIWF